MKPGKCEIETASRSHLNLYYLGFIYFLFGYSFSRLFVDIPNSQSHVKEAMLSYLHGLYSLKNEKILGSQKGILLLVYKISEKYRQKSELLKRTFNTIRMSFFVFFFLNEIYYCLKTSAVF